jgi:molecular chaperone HtpG
MTVEAHKETMGFQTEVKQLLHLMIHSLYSNKEIFLRELISNASDAVDKLRFEALSDDALFEGDSEFSIFVGFDKEARTITIRDNGVGMTRQEVIDHIGTIAKSGTAQFFENLSGDQAKDANLIGQFGVGFYSSFIVAEKVTLTTRRAGLGAEHGVCWESAGEGEFSLETVQKEARGTEVVLHLREKETEFLESMRLRNIIGKYSDHITLPIMMEKQQFSENEDDTPAEVELETVNRASALWARPKSEISAEDYNEFYKHVSHDFEEPLTYTHSRVEGKYEYTSLLYIPGKAPFDLWDREQRHGIKLYVRRVFIMDDADQLMPHYLRFIRGVIDSSDLPLNVSREILQHNKAIDTIRAGSIKKVLGLLEKMAKNDAEKYATFWQEFGRALKEGPGEDFSNQQRIAKLLRFSSTHTDSETQDVSLEDYIGRMQEDQQTLYYVTAESFAAAKNSPHLEIFRKKGIEVLLLSERVDEWLMSSLTEFDGKSFKSVAQGELNLGDMEDEAEKSAQEKTGKDFEDIVARVKTTLGDAVSDVRITHRLTSSPACLVSGEADMSANLERILKSAGQNIPGSKPVFEINPEHPLVLKLKDGTDESQFAELTQVLFDQALLAEGGQLEDPATFVKRMNELLLSMAK